MTLPETLKEYREERGLTYESMGKVFGITGCSYRKWEIGKAYPQSDRWEKIEKVTGYCDFPVNQNNPKTIRFVKQHYKEMSRLKMASILGCNVKVIGEIKKKLGVSATKKMGNCNNNICWECIHSVPSIDGKRGCPWSRHFRPVKGWDAELVRIDRGEVLTWHIMDCPKFEEG